MKNKTAIFGLYLPIFLLSVISTVTLRTVALLMNFDLTTGYFVSKTLINLSNALLVFFILLLSTFIFRGKKDMKLIPRFADMSTLITTSFVICALIFLMMSMAKNAFSIFGAAPIFAYGFDIREATLLLCILFGIFTIAYFVSSVLFEKKTNGVRANLGIVAIIFFALYASYLYFDTSLPLNAPNKLIDEMAYLSVSVFFLYETRLSLGRERWRGYIAFGFIGALLCAYSSIPSLIYYFVKRQAISISLYETALTLTLFVFITVRALLTGDLTKDKTSPKVQLLIDASDARSEEILANAIVTEPENEGTCDEIENQIAISDIADIDRTEEDIAKENEVEEQKQELIEQIDRLSTQEDG